jgi:hypothetical protein
VKRQSYLIVLGAATLLFLASSVPAMASITGLPTRTLHPATLLPAPTTSAPSSPGILSPFAPVVGASWAGAFDLNVTPPDTNGAIGPNSYLEIINTQLAIYSRTGTLINQSTLGKLTGHPQANLSDPMVLWDPDTQRFYYNVWDSVQSTMAWGFSKNNNPSAPGSFCSYTAHFGYSTSDIPDYPKLGQSKGFLLIGVNHYAGLSAPSSNRSDLLWINKPQGRAALTTCPAASTFSSGKFTNLRNQNGTQAFTPVPTIEDDVGTNGYVVASSDIECPPTCGTGTLVTVFVVHPSSTNPLVPAISAPHSITVPSYSPPTTVGAPQKGTTNTLDLLDGRLEHAVGAVNPSVGSFVIWTGHAIAGSGGRSQFRWYEIKPQPTSSPSLVASGTISSPSLYVFNGAVAPDRTVNPSGAAHGDSIVIGFSTSSSTTFPAAQMISQIGSSAPSGFVLVHQSPTADNDFSCAPKCRWGDYGGATSDPAQSLTAAHGEAWLTNEAVRSGNNVTWNWEARP